MTDDFSYKQLESFFNPSSVALIGVSRDINTFNGILLKNLLEINYKGKIYPVNPYAKEILGMKCFPRILELPETPELGIILHSDIIPILENCGKKGIKNIVIQSDISLKGDKEREDIERQIQEITRKYNISFIGPSLIGLINFPSNFTTSIIPIRSHIARLGEKSENASIGFMAQSGGLSGACGWWNPSQSMSFSKVIHLQEKFLGSVNEEQFLRYLMADENTKVISLFLRNISDTMIDIVRECSSKKPILFKKCGKPIKVDELKEAGALEVQNYLDLFEIAKVFVFSPLPYGNRIGLIGPSSGAIDVVYNEFKGNNLKIGKPSNEVREKLIKVLQGKLPRRCNPVDYWPPPRFLSHEVTKVHYDTADLLLSDDNIDALFLVLEFFHEIEINISIFGNLVKKYPDKPIMGVLIQAEKEGGNRLMKSATKLKIPIFKEPERLVKAYSLLNQFRQIREKGRETY
ncbi:MAG: CoA-binding protein [Candidatus Hodarchaeota archaeon]